MGILIIQDMPSLRPSQTQTLDNCTEVTILPDATQQAEFQRQLELLVTQKRNYPSIVAWVVYNEGNASRIIAYSLNKKLTLNDRLGSNRRGTIP